MGSSQTRARTRVPCIGRRILNHCATREAPGRRILNHWTTREVLPLVLRANTIQSSHLFLDSFNSKWEMAIPFLLSEGTEAQGTERIANNNSYYLYRVSVSAKIRAKWPNYSKPVHPHNSPLKLVFFFLAMPHGLQHLSSLTRDWTWATAVKAPSPNHWTAREFPKLVLYLISFCG